LTIKETQVKYQSVEIELFLADVLKKSKEFLYMNPGLILSSKHLNILSKLIKRREKGEPMAYILGHKDFMGLRFKVNKNVLIPRPETEELVDLVIASVAKQSKINKRLLRHFAPRNDIQILDVGTGSGCIIISIAWQLKNSKSQIPNLKFIASDISASALKVAKENAKKLLPLTPSPLPRGRGIKGEGVKINFVKFDLLKNIKFVPDIIIANLPYVPKKNYESRIKNLEWEPKIALVDPVKDFDIYERLLKQISSLPSLPKAIFLEIDPKAKKYVINYVINYLPKAKIKFYKDFNNLWRFVEITT